MRLFYPALACLFLLPSPSFAEAASTKEPTRIEIDQEAGEIHFFIKGDKKLTVDETGTRVYGAYFHEATNAHDQKSPAEEQTETTDE